MVYSYIPLESLHTIQKDRRFPDAPLPFQREKIEDSEDASQHRGDLSDLMNPMHCNRHT